MNDELFLEMVANEPGGARFPNVIQLVYSGQPTPQSVCLGNPTEREVFSAVKRLHAAGHLKYVRRYGYTWVVKTSYPASADEVIPTPEAKDLPYYWEKC